MLGIIVLTIKYFGQANFMNKTQWSNFVCQSMYIFKVKTIKNSKHTLKKIQLELRNILRHHFQD